MKQKNYISNLLELNLAVLFISTSGVLGKYIELSVPFIIFLRAIIACVILLLYVKFKKISFKASPKARGFLWLGGLALGAHWITYFYALKFSNVAIAMISLYTFPVLTALLEPLILKNKLLNIHLFLGVLVTLGIYLLVPSFNFEDQHFWGVCFGVLSALFYSLRNILIKSKASEYNQSDIMLNQLAAISIFLIPTIFMFDNSNTIEYLPSIFLLGILTTAIGHTLFVNGIKKFPVTSASLISSLQPVYGIILAFIFLNEIPKSNTVIGGLVILSLVVFESFRLSRTNKNDTQQRI